MLLITKGFLCYFSETFVNISFNTCSRKEKDKRRIRHLWNMFDSLNKQCFLLLPTQKWSRFISLDFLTAGVTKTVFVHSMDAPLLLCDILALSLRKKADIATFDDDNLVKTTKTLCIYRAA